MTPQVTTVLKHLQQHGSISQAEASTVYKIRALPRRIADLKAVGYKVISTLKKDPTGQRYARYHLGKEPKVGDRVKVVKAESIITRIKVGRVGVVKDMEKDSDSKYGHDYFVLLEGEERTSYFYGTEIELVAN